MPINESPVSRLFNEATLLTQDTEATLASGENSKNIFTAFKRLMWLPFQFLKVGMTERLYRPLMLYPTLVFLCFVVVACLDGFIPNMPRELARLLINISVCLPMPVIVFCMPSTYAHCGVTQEMINSVVIYLRNRGLNDESDIALIRQFISSFASRAKSRVTRLKWLVGIFWSFLVYLMDKQFDAGATKTPHFLSQLVEYFVMFGLLLVVFVVIWSYEAAILKLFNTLEFGCDTHSALITRHRSHAA